MSHEIVTRLRNVEQVFVTDPGVDDAFANLVANALFTRAAYVATYGNDTVEQTAANLRGLAQFMDAYRRDDLRPEPLVFAGAATKSTGKTMVLEEKYGGREGNLFFIHGDSAMEGLGDSVREISDRERSGVLYEWMKEKRMKKIDVFSFGALTEVYLMLSDPRLRSKVKSITVMGGAFREPGNVEPNLEANFRHDPLALQRIIQIANKWMIPITIVPLDVTHDKRLEFTPKVQRWLDKELRSWGSVHIADYISDLIKTYEHFYTTVTTDRTEQKAPYGPRTFRGPPIHDLVALMVQVHPELFVIAKKRVKVTLRGKQAGAIGEAQEHMSPIGSVDVAMKIKNKRSAKRFWNYIANALALAYR